MHNEKLIQELIAAAEEACRYYNFQGGITRLRTAVQAVQTAKDNEPQTRT